jgi:hypothetical protein
MALAHKRDVRYILMNITIANKANRIATWLGIVEVSGPLRKIGDCSI